MAGYFQELQLLAFQEVILFLGKWGLQVNLGSYIWILTQGGAGI